ncbi:hypothetical protein Tco_0699050 [Tanacetum coccineum]
MSSYNHLGCSCCGGPFNGGNCPSCSSVGSGNEFVYDPNPYSYNETPNFFNQPPQHQYETYSCEFCGGNSHPGFDCQTGNTPVFDQDPASLYADSDLIESLLNQDTLIIFSPKIHSLLEEFSGELAHIDLIPPGINETNFDPEEDIRLLERLFNYSPSLPINESFHFDVLSSRRPLAKPRHDDEIKLDMGVLTAKVVGDISELYVHVPNVLTTLPTLSPMFDTLLPFSSEKCDKVFNLWKFLLQKRRNLLISYLIGALKLSSSFLIFLKAR